MTMGKLEGKVAVITGGLSGIGRQIARRFGEEGAPVAIMDAREASRDDGMGGAEVAASLAAGGRFIQGDVRAPEDLDALFADAVGAYGRVDVLVSCAGVALFKPA